MKALSVRLAALAALVFAAAGKAAANGELAGMDKPLVAATPLLALAAALVILLIPLVIITLVLWSRRSREP